MRKYFLLLSFLLVFSCGKKEDELVESAIREANYFLTTMKCSKAKSALDQVDYQSDNALYIQTYASMYACKAGYTELGTMFANMTNLSSSSLLTSLASFDSSNEKEADSTAYTNLMQAIYTLLAAGGGAQPSAAKRLEVFGTRKGTDISNQALYLIMVTMGKYFAYYGNADATGFKGQGTGSNNCIADYPLAGVDADLSGTPLGTCDGGAAGHADLSSSVAAATLKRRMCEGIIMFNNLFDILSNISVSSNDSLGDLSNVSTAVQTLFNAAIQAEALLSGTWGGTAIATLKNITDQDLCEAESYEDLQRFFVLLFETNHTSS